MGLCRTSVGRIIGAKVVKDKGEYNQQNQLNRSQRSSQKLNQQTVRLHGCISGPPYPWYGNFLACYFCWSPTSGSGGVFKSFSCWWAFFSPTGLPCLALIGVFMLNLIVICLFVFILTGDDTGRTLLSRGWVLCLVFHYRVVIHSPKFWSGC